jgi:hypothetical protein
MKFGSSPDRKNAALEIFDSQHMKKLSFFFFPTLFICAALVASFSFAQSPQQTAPGTGGGDGITLAAEKRLRNERQ